MKRRASKAEAIRRAVNEGKSTKEITSQLNVPAHYVYNEKYKMKKAGALAAEEIRKIVAEYELYSQPVEKQSPELNAYKDDLSSIETQILDLENVASFLRHRIQQMEQNSKWATLAK